MVRVPPLEAADIARDEGRRSGGDMPSSRDTDLIRSLVIYKDEDIIALNKPAGLAVQGGTRTTRHVDAMLPALQTGEYRPKLVHRLDRDTSGVLLLARHPNAAARLGRMFRDRSMKKVYWAVTAGVPVPQFGQVRSWMMKGTSEDGDREKMILAKHGDKSAQHAVTDYAVISVAAQRAAWVALSPQTGRTHQLRFHMEEIGNAIIGDPKYTGRREPLHGLGKGLHLHARALIIPPEKKGGKTIQIVANLPQHMQETFDTLGFLESEAGSDPLAVLG